MFKGKKTTATHIDEEEEDVGSDYSVDSEIDENVHVDAEEEVEDVVPIRQHLKPDSYANMESMIIDIDFVGSPQDFATGAATSTWTVNQDMTRHFKQNMSDKDRHLATDDKLAGHVKRAIPVAFQIIQQMNSLPFAGEIRCEKMLPRTMHRENVALHRCQHCDLMSVDLNVFSPTSLVDKDMVENSRVCTPEMIEDTVNMVEAKGGKNKNDYGTVVIRNGAKKTLAYNMLTHNLRKGKFAGEGLSKDQIDAILYPTKKQRIVEITANMARGLKTKLLKDANDMLERCMDLEKDLTFTYARSDGETTFNSANKLEGSLIGAIVDETNAAQNNPLLTAVGTFHVKAIFRYMTL